MDRRNKGLQNNTNLDLNTISSEMINLVDGGSIDTQHQHHLMHSMRMKATGKKRSKVLRLSPSNAFNDQAVVNSA